MNISETSIKQWADCLDCRSNLPILIRRLIRETTSGLVSLRFPGNEAVDLPGLDGQVEVSSPTDWVPQGHSVWEMGCNQKPITKAKTDYDKRTSETALNVRKNSSYIFVTPRRWNNKDEWLEQRRAEGDWDSIHVYDAIDLETWLENAPVTSRWLGEKLGLTSQGLKTPNEWWQGWASASKPSITTKLISTRRYNEHETLLKRLRDDDEVVSIQADSREEAVAFTVATLIEDNASDLLDRMLVVTSGGTRIPTNSNGLIILVDLAEGETLDLGDRRNIKLIRAYSKGRLDVQNAIQLSHVPSETFCSELEVMGLDSESAYTTALRTGHSVAILRRHLSTDPEIKRPIWACDRKSVKQLLPFALVNSWVERENFDDVVILQLLGEFEEGEVKRIRDELLLLDDAPLARYGHVNLLVSQLDAFFAVGPYIEWEDLERFFQLLPELLGERDPALDLPQDQWWIANIIGHARNYSGAVLSGLGDALCILSIHGNEICGNRLGVDLSYRAEQVVRTLMEDANEERWLSIRGYLRIFAEASPAAFLDCLEKELVKPEPAIRSIMGTIDGGVSGECLRVNLLWALESLAWHSVYFSRVAEIVFGLRELEVIDNHSKCPKETARSLFRTWRPVTVLSAVDRMGVLRNLSSRFRSSVIDVCISLLPAEGPRFASKTVSAKWLELETELVPPTKTDIFETQVESSRLLLDLAPYDNSEIEILIKIFPKLQADDLTRLDIEVENWSINASDEAKALVRNQLRRREVMRTRRGEKERADIGTFICKLKKSTRPNCLNHRYRWLFDAANIEWPSLFEASGYEGESLNWEEQARLIEIRRCKAISDIEQQVGKQGVLIFAMSVEKPYLVAWAVVPPNSPTTQAVEWVVIAMQVESNDQVNEFLQQILWNISDVQLDKICDSLGELNLLKETNQRQRFAKCLPDSRAGWELARSLGEDVNLTYWSKSPFHFWRQRTPEDLEHVVENLLVAGRPRLAFSVASQLKEKLAVNLWVKILQDIPKIEEIGEVLPDSYDLNKVLKIIDDSEEVADDFIVQLERPFVSLLCGDEESERTLAIHKDLLKNPSSFVEILCWYYPRANGEFESDFDELPLDRRKMLTEYAGHILDGWKDVIGQKTDGGIDAKELTNWLDEALVHAANVDRKGIAETHLGELLARFVRRRPWDDWLPECILEFLNRQENGDLRKKFEFGIRNSRGFTSRSLIAGGDQERTLAGCYRDIASRYSLLYPRVSSSLISLAEYYDRDAGFEDNDAVIVERWSR